MPTIKIIDKIYTSDNGPLSIYHRTDDREEIFLSQGSFEGMPGHYCIFMCLIICGLVSRDEIQDSLTFGRDINSSIKTIHHRIKQSDFLCGSALTGITRKTGIQDLFEGIYKNELELETCGDPANRHEFITFVFEHLTQDNPVLVGFQWPDSADSSWMVLIGMEFNGQPCEENLYRFLGLDPGGKEMDYSPWNAVIGIGGPCAWLNMSYVVQIKEAIAFVRTGEDDTGEWDIDDDF